jgi:hypothetical protein
MKASLAGGEWSASRPGRFTPGVRAPVPIGKRVRWTPEPVWTTLRRDNFVPYRDSNSDHIVVEPLASRYTDCAVPAPNLISKERKILIFANYHNNWKRQIIYCHSVILSVLCVTCGHKS